MKTTMFHGDGFLPFVGLGTCNLGTTEEELIRILNTALDVGYRLFDTANGYNNESGIGKFLHHLPIPRSEVFITSKLNDNLHSYTAASSAVDETLNRLHTEYLDLFLIHNPNSQMMRESMKNEYEKDHNYWIKSNIETWQALEECVIKGKIKNIGVSNFEIRHIEALLPHIKIKPLINQIKYCVGCYGTQERLIEYCKQKGILIQGYSPFGKGNAVNIPQIQDIAARLDCGAKDVILSYLRKKGIPTIIKASCHTHLISNLHPHYVVLTDDDIRIIESCVIKENWAKIKNPDTGEKYN